MDVIEHVEGGGARAAMWQHPGANVADSGSVAVGAELRCALWRDPASLWQSE
jgi:hypothetical protein